MVYQQSDTPLLTDVFKTFRNKRLENFEVDLAHFSSASIDVAGMFIENRNQTGTTNRYQYVTNCLKWQHGWNMSCSTNVCKSQ